MKCISCDVILSNDEATTKSPITDDYLDMCNACLDSIVRAENPISSSNDGGIDLADFGFCIGLVYDKERK